MPGWGRGAVMRPHAVLGYCLGHQGQKAGRLWGVVGAGETSGQRYVELR